MENPGPENVPKWIQELEEKVLKIYAELIETNLQRKKHHGEAAEALNKAVNAAQLLTLGFLEQIKTLNNTEDSDENFPYS